MGSNLRYATISYGGAEGAAWEGKVRHGNVNVYYARVNLDHCTLSYSGGNGLELDEYDAQVTNCLFLNNGITDSHYDIYAELTVKPETRIEGCQFRGTRPYALYLSANTVGGLLSNTFDPNRGILIRGGPVEGTATWRNHGIPYRVSGDVTVAGPDAPVLTLQPGVTLRFDDSVGLFVGTLEQPGGLIADGATMPITMTSSGPERDVYWAGLSFDQRADTSVSIVRGVRISYGGRGYPWHDTYCDGNININRCGPQIEQCEIHHSAQQGVSMFKANPVLRGNVFHDNGLSTLGNSLDIFTDEESAPVIEWNTFGAGQRYAVQLSAAGMGRMQNNTFGDPQRGIIIVGGAVDYTATWMPQGTSHCQVLGNILVAGTNRPVLTLESGLVLEFAERAGFYVGTDILPGALRINGGAAGVRLTEAKEGLGWPGLFFDAGCDAANTELRGAILERAGNGSVTTWHDQRWDGTVNIYQSAPTLLDGEIASSYGQGVLMQGGAPVLRGNFFHHNGSLASHYDILCDDVAAPVIERNQFGLGAEKQLYAARLPAAAAGVMRDNKVHPSKAIYLVGGLISQNAAWMNQGMSHYYVKGNVTVAGPNTPVLTLDAGITVRFARASGLYIGTEVLPGALVAEGGSTAIHLTCAELLEGWSGLFLDAACDTSATRLNGMVLDYGGTDTTWHGKVWNGNLNLYRASPIIVSSVLSHSKKHGIVVEAASPTIVACAFSANGSLDSHYDVLCDSASLPTIRHNTFQTGRAYAVRMSVQAAPKLAYNVLPSSRSIYLSGGTLTSDSDWRAATELCLLRGELDCGGRGAEPLPGAAREQHLVFRRRCGALYRHGYRAWDAARGRQRSGHRPDPLDRDRYQQLAGPLFRRDGGCAAQRAGRRDDPVCGQDGGALERRELDGEPERVRRLAALARLHHRQRFSPRHPTAKLAAWPCAAACWRTMAPAKHTMTSIAATARSSR